MAASRRIQSLWVLILILGLLLIFQVTGIITLYNQSSHNTMEYTWNELSDLALLIAADLDAQALSELREGEENSPGFQRMIEQLWKMQNEHSAIRFVYTLEKKGDKLAFLTDSEYGRNDFSEPLIGYIYEEAPPEAFEAFNEVTVRKEYYSDPWGTYISAYAPVRNESGYPVAVVGVDFTKEFVESRLADLVNAGLIILIISTLMSVIIFLILLHTLQLSRQYQHQVEASEILLKQILDSIQTGVLLVDEKTQTIRFANPKASELCGCEQREMEGKPADSFFEARYLAHREGEPGEYRIQGTGRSTTVLLTRKTLSINGKNMIVQSFTDISLFKKAEEDIRRTAAEREKNSQALADANRKLNMMSSVTRHDIINKAMMANGYLELLAEYLTPGGESYYQITREAIREIHRIIEFTRTYQDLGVQTPLWQNLQALIRTIPDPGHLITVLNAATEIYADPLLVKVFENLYDNSVRHGGEGLSAIRISTRPAGDALDLIWEDDGEGIPDNEKEKIFARGYGKNTGFGLFIIREILGITRITIIEDGRYGMGARFILRIPEGSFHETGSKEKGS